MPHMDRETLLTAPLDLFNAVYSDTIIVMSRYRQPQFFRAAFSDEYELHCDSNKL